MKTIARFSRLFPASLVLALAMPWLASASDGVLEINQTCAVTTGCVAGDAPGFPVTLASAGSYVLTSDLDVSVSASPTNTTGIVVQSEGTSLDLNGFAILGPVTCSKASFEPVVCGRGGAGSGVSANSVDAVEIRNGRIQGMGSWGIRCNRGCRVEAMRIAENAGGGILFMNGHGVVRDNVVLLNGGDGFFGIGSLTSNVFERNAGVGIFDRGDSVIAHNTSYDNGGNGVRCNRCALHENTINSNAGYGVEFFGSAGYSRNQIQNNDTGTVTGPGVELGPNLCASNTTCP